MDLGDEWDHVALAVESRLVVSLVSGKRTEANTHRLIADFADRTNHKLPDLFTSDEHAAYRYALAKQYTLPEPLWVSGRPTLHPQLTYATVKKTRVMGRVVEVEKTLVFGSQGQLGSTLKNSNASNVINTSFIERYNATDRHFNKRKARKSYCFSKTVRMHRAATWLGITAYNFCRTNRALQRDAPGGGRLISTPAMAAGLTTRHYSLSEVIGFQLLT